jgi:hypothetical protein
MTAKQLSREIAEGLREHGLEIDEVDAWPVSDYYLYASDGANSGFFRLTPRGDVFAIPGTDKSVEDAVREMGFRVKKDHKRTIFVAFEIVTPESAEDGDVAEAGEQDEEEIIPVQGETFVSTAVTYLRGSGAFPADGADWFETGWSEDYQSGESENHTFHLRGFTDEEENMIWSEMKKKKRSR